MDKINIVLSSSQQYENKCVMGDVEAEHMRRIAMYIYENLKSYPRLNVYLVPKSDKERDAARLREAVDMSNKFIKDNGRAGYHLALHSDAGAYATGASLLYKSATGLKFGTPIIEGLMQLTPWNDVGIKQRNDLYELNKTLAYAALIEISFHDSADEGKWIHENLKPIADNITRGIVKGVGLA